MGKISLAMNIPENIIVSRKRRSPRGVLFLAWK
jgi:hypothetical protein